MRKRTFKREKHAPELVYSTTKVIKRKKRNERKIIVIKKRGQDNIFGY